MARRQTATPRPAGRDSGRAGRRPRLRLPRRGTKGPGATPGIDAQELAQMPQAVGPVQVTCIDYGPDHHQVEQVGDFEDFLTRHRPEWSAVRWINVDGLSNPRVIEGLATKYHLHPLAVEDVLHVGQRPKVDAYAGREEYQARLFIVCRMLQVTDDRPQGEQVSLFLGHKTVLTFQEAPGDAWDPIRQRLGTRGARIRGEDASFLVYSLLDAAVDQCFPILEDYGERLEALEDLVLDRPDRETLRAVRLARSEMLALRHTVWPLREVVAKLQREHHECLSDNTRVYLRDLYDHVVQIIDLVTAYREVASGLHETYMTALSHRLGEVMKVLTIVGTVFIPVTFLAGVYGMNFHHMPELDQPWAYPAFWGVCAALAGGMVLWFRRRGWL